jgi:hypothetical protein
LQTKKKKKVHTICWFKLKIIKTGVAKSILLKQEQILNSSLSILLCVSQPEQQKKVCLQGHESLKV